MDFKLLSFFTCFLILSITPCSAVMIANGDGLKSPHTKSKATVNNSLNMVDQDLDELDGVIFGLNQSVAHIMEKKDDYGWRFWEWPGITNDIAKTASKIHSNANKCKKIISKIKNHVYNFKLGKERSKLSNEDSSNINNVNDSFCQKDAENMAKELTEALNATFTVQNTSASMLREGDIVQYLSEGKYPRYLKVQKIESSNTTEKILKTSPIDISTGYLECTGDKIVEVPLIGTVICLVQPNGVNVGDTLNTAVVIQQNSIDTTRKEGEELDKRAGRIDNSIDALIGLDKFMATVMLGAAFEALITGIITPPSWAGEIITLIFAILTFTIGFILVELNSAYKDLNGESNELITSADSCEKDLDTYTATEEKTNIFMNVTTFNGIPIIKQPPLSDWKSYNFVRIEDPQHGDLLPGPGLQFLYGPNEGYIGNDRFKFQYTDKYGRVKGNITVNIVVSPIPVFNIPTLNKTPSGVES